MTESKPKKMHRVTALTICMVLIVAAVAGIVLIFSAKFNENDADQEITILKLGHGLPTEHPVHKAMEFMGKRLDELSGGTMKMEIYPSGMVGSEAQCLDQVQVGLLAMCKTSTAVLEGFIPEMTAIGLPYVFRDEEHLWKVLNGEIGKKLLDAPKKMKGLCYYDAGARSFYTVKTPIRSLADMNGLKIRVQQSKSSMDMVSDFGASPTPISFGELYTALSQGAVDGAENNLPSFDTAKHYEICKYYTFNEHTMVPDMLVMSREIWDGLNGDQQKWLQQAADESLALQRVLWKEAEAATIEKAKAAGVEFITVDKEPFAEAVQATLAEQPEVVQEVVKAILEVK